MCDIHVDILHYVVLIYQLRGEKAGNPCSRLNLPVKPQPLLRGSWSSSWWISLILHCGGCTWAARQVALTRELLLWQKCHLFPRPGYSAGIWLGPVSHPFSSQENERKRHVLLAHYLNGRRATRVLLSDRESQPLLPPAVLLDNCALTCSGSFILAW